MAIQFDTFAIEPRHRFARWQDALSDLFVRLDTVTDAGEDFHMRVDRSMFGPVMSAWNTSSRQNIHRTSRHIAHADQEVLVLSLVIQGAMSVAQDDREAVVRAGEFALYDANRPYVLRIGDDNVQTVIQIPRASIIRRLGQVDSLTAGTFGRDQALAGIAFDLLTGIARVADGLSAEAGNKLADQSLDILSLALREKLGGESRPVSAHRSLLLLRLKAFIQTHLSDSDLALADAASAMGITPRYVNSLLALERTSFRRYLLSLRLERCARDLSDAASRHRSIGDIAFAAGFNDLAHFCHVFKARYGLSPRAWRQKKTARG